MSDNKYLSLDTDGKKHLKDFVDLSVSSFSNDAGYVKSNDILWINNLDSNKDGKVDACNVADSVDWSGVTSKPSSAVSNIDESVSMRHTHANKTTIDKFSEIDNMPYYNGNELALSSENVTKTSQLVNDSGFTTNLDLDKKTNKLTTFIEDDIITISSIGGLRDSGKKLTDFAPTSSIVTKTSQLTNDSNFIVDSNYVHTDNNYTTTEKTNLSNQSGTNTGDETNTTIKTKLGVSNTTTDGYLTSTDYNKFNNKIDSVKISKDGTLVGSEKQLNLIEGTGVTLAVTDNTSTNSVDISISSTNGGGTVKSVNTITPNVSTGDVTLTKTDLGLGSVDNIQQLPMSYLDITDTLGTSDVKIPTQKAIKTYVDNGLSNKSNVTTSTINGNIKIDNIEKTVYTLPIPTETTIGGVKAGNNITISVDGTISSVIAGGDMLKSTYDSNSDGIVNDSDKLGGQLPSYYAKESDLTTGLGNKADKVIGATNGNFASLDTSGNLVDSGKKASDFTSVNDSVITSTTQTYSIDKILTLIATKQNKVYLQSTQPTSPIINDIWINNSSSPFIINVYDGSIFNQVGGASSGETITNWTSGNAYAINDLVIHDGNIYQCVTPNSDLTWIIANWVIVSKGDKHSSTHLTGENDAIDLATTITDGLFSHTDKAKLDSIMTNGTWNLFQI